jgi:hypothetical protein
MRDALTSRRAFAILAIVIGVALVGALLWALATGRGGPPAGSSRGGGVGSSGSGAGPAASASRGPGAASPPRAGAGSGASVGPSAAAANGFLTALGAIDPRLVADKDRALTAGRATCQDFAERKPYDEVVAGAVARFRAPGVPVDSKKGTLIVDAARNNLCPG